jgi:hypothetical protein
MLAQSMDVAPLLESARSGELVRGNVRLLRAGKLQQASQAGPGDIRAKA